MIADRAWVERNIGFDPLKTTAPVETYAFKPAAKSTADRTTFNATSSTLTPKALRGPRSSRLRQRPG